MSIFDRTIKRRTLLKSGVPVVMVFSGLVSSSIMALRIDAHSANSVGYGRGGYGDNTYPAGDDGDDLYLPFVTKRGS